jgi:hypothetical protein
MYVPKPETLNQAATNKQYSRPHAERFICWQYANDCRRRAHNEQGQIKHGLTPDPVAVMSKDQTANGRATKPIAYFANACNVPIMGSKVEKNDLLKISAATVPTIQSGYAVAES